MLPSFHKKSTLNNVVPSPELVYQKLQEQAKVISTKGQNEFTRAMDHFKADSNLRKIKKDKRIACAMKKLAVPSSRFKRSYMRDDNGEIYVFGHGCIYRREILNREGSLLKIIRVKFRFSQNGTPSIVKIIQENVINTDSAQVYHNEMSIAHHFQQALDDKATIRELEAHTKAYLAFPFRGMSLTDIWRADLLSANQHLTLYILKEIFLKIHHIHEEGYLHRDLKTDNIMLDVTWNNEGKMSLALNSTNTPTVHIMDYGFSVKLVNRQQEYESKNLCGTKDHLPQELKQFEINKRNRRNANNDLIYVYNRALDYYAASVDGKILLKKINSKCLTGEDVTLYDQLTRINASMQSYRLQQTTHTDEKGKETIKITLVSTSSPQLHCLQPLALAHVQASAVLPPKQIPEQPTIPHANPKQLTAASISQNDSDSNDSDLLATLKRATQEIFDAYNKYFNCCSFFTFKHGGKGKKRARDLNREVNEATNTDNIKAAFKNCFASYKTCWNRSGETNGINNHSLIAFILKIFAKSEYQLAAEELGLTNLAAEKNYFSENERDQRQQLKNQLNQL